MNAFIQKKFKSLISPRSRASEMENDLPSYERPPRSSNSVIGGVCMMSSAWKDEQHPSFSKFISAFLTANDFRLNVVRIAPDFIFNCGGTSTAFLFVTNWDCDNHSRIFTRVQKLKGQFAHFYVVLTLPTKDQNDSFVRAYFKYGSELGQPTFVPVQDLEMGFEKIVNITHTRGVFKRQDVISNLKAEKKSMVQSMDAFVRVVTSIPGINAHDANMLNHAVGSIEAIAKASREYLLENTDLSQEKVDTITRIFRDRKFYLSTHIQ